MCVCVYWKQRVYTEFCRNCHKNFKIFCTSSMWPAPLRPPPPLLCRPAATSPHVQYTRVYLSFSPCVPFLVLFLSFSVSLFLLHSDSFFFPVFSSVLLRHRVSLFTFTAIRMCVCVCKKFTDPPPRTISGRVFIFSVRTRAHYKMRDRERPRERERDRQIAIQKTHCCNKNPWNAHRAVKREVNVRNTALSTLPPVVSRNIFDMVFVRSLSTLAMPSSPVVSSVRGPRKYFIVSNEFPVKLWRLFKAAEEKFINEKIGKSPKIKSKLISIRRHLT